MNSDSLHSKASEKMPLLAPKVESKTKTVLTEWDDQVFRKGAATGSEAFCHFPANCSRRPKGYFISSTITLVAIIVLTVLMRRISDMYPYAMFPLLLRCTVVQTTSSLFLYFCYLNGKQALEPNNEHIHICYGRPGVCVMFFFVGLSSFIISFANIALFMFVRKLETLSVVLPIAIACIMYLLCLAHNIHNVFYNIPIVRIRYFENTTLKV